jgi:sarcosine oxidase subunit beta
VNEIIQLVASCLKRSFAALSCGLCKPFLRVCCHGGLFSLVHENHSSALSRAESQLTARKRQALKAQGTLSRTDALSSQYRAGVYLETPLTKANWVGSSWQVETPKGIFEAEYLVNAAGAWAGEVARRAGWTVPVQPVRRMVYATVPTAWHHTYPLTIDLASGFYLRSEGDRILFGRSNQDEPPGFTEGVDWEWFEPTIRVGSTRFPWLAEVGLDHRACWWGYYEVTPDHNPILGRLPAAENWVNVAGFSGHGVQQAPMVGRLIAEEITLGKAQSVNIDSLRIDRLFDHQQYKEYNII